MCCADGEFCCDGVCLNIGTPTFAPCAEPGTSCCKLDPICVCPAIYTPVCGANGKTHGNACEARCAGVKVVRASECTKSCTCPAVVAPVCSVDEIEYVNRCEAERVGVDIGRDGPCLKQPIGDPECSADCCKKGYVCCGDQCITFEQSILSKCACVEGSYCDTQGTNSCTPALASHPPMPEPAYQSDCCKKGLLCCGDQRIDAAVAATARCASTRADVLKPMRGKLRSCRGGK
jgi:hypothetical protein